MTLERALYALLYASLAGVLLGGLLQLLAFVFGGVR